MMDHHLTPQGAPVSPRSRWLNAANAPILRFQLDEELGTGGDAEATVLRWDPSQEDYVETDHTITVVDALGIFSGQEGDRGYARWWSDRKAFEITLMECP